MTLPECNKLQTVGAEDDSCRLQLSLRGAIATWQSPGKQFDVEKSNETSNISDYSMDFGAFEIDRLYQEIATSGRCPSSQ